MKLADLIYNIDVINIVGNVDTEILALTFDSREVTQGSLFVAIAGTETDGHRYIPRAVESGAAAVVCESLPSELPGAGVYLRVKNSRRALSLIASAWFGHPSKEITLVGVTGTNGKTTIATLLYKVNTGLGFKAGILTTIDVVIDQKHYPATHTTPDPIQINMWLRKMVNAGCEYCFMEVSSHAASQHRIDGLHFRGGIFTNLTHDHLDYHKSFRDYLEAKRRFFEQLDQGAFALINVNDKNGEVMVQSCKAEKYRYALGKMSDFHAKILEMLFEGMHLQINEKDVWIRLTGRFNAMNVLAVFGASVILGHSEEDVLQALSQATPVEGRFDIVKGRDGRNAIVDYAHTDDALQNVLETIHEVNRNNDEIITVVGAGGDRDKTKRPKMGAVAAKFSSKVILTSDNPRSENPETIMAEMEAGIPDEFRASVLKITDREEAIKTACMLASPRAVILLAGKGHEKYQISQGIKHHFDDKEIIAKYLK